MTIPTSPSTDVLPKPPTQKFAHAIVRVTAGPDAGRECRLEPGTTRVGTAPSCALRLSDAAVSRLHCELRVEPAGVRVVDSGSTNGTRVDGLDVVEARLRDSARIDIGNTTLALEIHGEPIEVTLAPRERFGRMLGISPVMRHVFQLMATVAPTNATVLFQGETGTGKELAAQAIHESSRRPEGPFVAVDCGAIAEHLIESELFGHLRGAFTGATSDRRGLFEEASGGTLFLDEIGELPLSLQPKLLRALEEREVRPVGSNTPRTIDVRVIAATNRPLASAVNAGAFREDLYYRLAVFEIVLPPLRERREDLDFLAEHFHASATGKPGQLAPELLASIRSRSWPGNVRELRNFIERSAILGLGHDRPAAATSASLEIFASADLPMKEARERCMAQFEGQYVASLLRRTGGNVTRAAEIAGVSRRYLHKLISERKLR